MYAGLPCSLRLVHVHCLLPFRSFTFVGTGLDSPVNFLFPTKEQNEEVCLHKSIRANQNEWRR